MKKLLLSLLSIVSIHASADTVQSSMEQVQKELAQYAESLLSTCYRAQAQELNPRCAKIFMDIFLLQADMIVPSIATIVENLMDEKPVEEESRKQEMCAIFAEFYSRLHKKKLDQDNPKTKEAMQRLMARLGCNQQQS